MDDLQRQQIVRKALGLWKNEQPLQAGGIIFECIPVDMRYLWAFDILKFAYSLYPQNIEIDKVLEFAEHPEKWKEGREKLLEAHRIVDNVNHSDELILQVATQAGKIIYTSQQFPAPFDHVAGWKIVEYLKEIVRDKKDELLEEKAWEILTNPKYLLLDAPVMCHPNCPSCLNNDLIKK